MKYTVPMQRDKRAAWHFNVRARGILTVKLCPLDKIAYNSGKGRVPFSAIKRVLTAVQCALIVAACTLFIVSCASSPDDDKAFNKAYDAGDYAKCAKLREKSDKGKGRIDYMLDVAMLEHNAGDWEASSKYCELTEKRIDEAFTKSITRSVGSTLLNDNIAEYTGNIYEYLMVNAFNSLNYYNRGDVEGAMVEIRKLDVKNKEYVNQYGEVALADDDASDNGETSSALSTAGVDMRNVLSQSPQKPTEEDVYKDSALVRYLGVVFRNMYGDMSGNDEVDGKYLAALNSDFDGAWRDEVSTPRGWGRVDVLSMTGKIAAREADYKVFPLGLLSVLAPNLLAAVGDPTLFNLTFGFPRYVPREENIVPLEVTLSNAEGEAVSTFTLKKLEDFDEAVRKDVTVKARRAYIRSIYRSTAKKVTTIATSEAALVAANNGGEMASLIANITAATAIRGSLAALDKSETPDIRQCTHLPRSAWAGGVYVMPGTYIMTIKYSNGAVRVKDGILVRRDKTTLVETICVK